MKRFGQLVLVAMGLVLGYQILNLYLSKYPYGDAQPPDSVQALPEYLTWRPKSDFFLVVSFEQRSTLLVEGLYEEMPPFSSGPAAYVFDENGRLLDWSRDRGDDSEFVKEWWPNGSRTKRLSKEEALAQFNIPLEPANTPPQQTRGAAPPGGE